ncbi:MAG: FG-GAP-like repeat-containing protein [Lysobacteraceae bacterium]
MLALLVSSTLLATSPGLPLTEDFTDTNLRDAAQTSAAWSPEEQAVYLAWSQARQQLILGGSGSAIGTFNTESIAVGDVNQDGHLDVVLGNSPQYLRLFINNGSGGFLPSTTVGGTPTTVSKVILGDMNGDGHLDLLAAYAAGTSKLFLNDGSGGFPTGVNIATDGSQNRDMLLADVNRDGWPDLIMADTGGFSDPNRLYLNNGSGGFAATGTAIGAEIDVSSALAIGDVDRDGDLDLIVGNLGSSNKLYLNNGSGVFSATGTPVSAEDNTTFSLALGDLDGDGDLDLVTGTSSGRLSTWQRNNGSGVFESVGTPIGNSTNSAEAVTLADVDADGDLDVLLANAFAHNLLYLNDGSGGFPAVGRVVGTTSGDYTRDAQFADIDGDGLLDLIVANDGNPTRLFLSGAVDGWIGGINLGNEVESTREVALGDVDGDGDLDVVAANNGQPNRLYLNDGYGGFPATGTAIGSESDKTYAVALGDVDGDGDLDLIAGSSLGDATRLYFNDGSGAFSGTGTVIDSGDNVLTLALGDLDRDGDLDLVLGNQNSVVHPTDAINRYYLNDGNGGFSANNLGSDAQTTNSIVLSDVDGDGDLDILVGNNGTNRLYLNDGSAVFPATGTPIGSETDLTSDLVLGDIDSDGDLDLIVANSGASMKRYMNLGGGTFSATGTDLGGGTEYASRVTLGDIDADGDIDLLAANTTGLGNLIYLNSGNGSFSATGMPFSSDTNFGTGSFVLADLDRDGDLDLVVGNSGETNKRYFNGGRGAFRPATTFDSDADTTSSLAFGDVDGDGDVDVITGNLGQTNKLYLNDGGDFPLTGTPIGSETDSTLSIALGDVNLDGALDLIVGNSGQTNKRYLNNGSGGFPATGTAIGGELDTTRSIALGDLNHDGKLDVVAVNGSGQTNKRYLNNGSGGFPASGTPFGEDDTGNASAVALGDIDGDGDLDIVVGKVAGVASKWYENDGNGVFPTLGNNVGNEVSATNDLVLGDLNADGALDVILGNDSDHNRVYLNDGSGVFPTSGTAVQAVNDFTSSVALADLDLDGDLDLIVGNVSQRNRRYLNDGAGGFTGTGIDLGTETDYTRAVALADIDKDGDLDLILGNSASLGGAPNRLQRFSSFTTLGRATSTQVNTTPNSGDSIRAVNLTAMQTVNTASSRNTAIDYYLSNNGGTNWYRAYPGEDFLFPASGTDLRWRAELSSLSPQRTPMITQLDISLVPTVPEAPVILAALALDASAQILFGIVPNNGSPITGYSVTSDPDNINVACADSGCIIPGLTNGVEYTFTLTATNAVGESLSSEPSNAVTPQGTQAIDFAALADRFVDEPPFSVAATGGASGNPVTFASLTPVVCSTSGSDGSTITLNAIGTCTLRASQAGNAGYTAAADVDQSFTVIEPKVFKDGFE